MNKIKFTIACFVALGSATIYIVYNKKTDLVSSAENRLDIIPIPTHINERMKNEKEFEERKENYLEIIHGNYTVNWRAINVENFRTKVEQRMIMKGSRIVESYANGAIVGEWLEKGSNDQAGNVRVMAFDEQSEAIYGVGDGGILFKGDLLGSPWESLNDHYILDKNVLETIRLPNGDLRILGTIGNGVWYSDDEGLTWEASMGFAGTTGDGNGIDLLQLNDVDSTLVYLYTYVGVNGSGQNKLAYSKDHGVSFNLEHVFNSSNGNYASMASIHKASIAYILDNDDDVWVFEYDSIYQIADAMALQGGSTCQIEVSTSTTDTLLYILMDSEHLYKSTDGGYNFGQLPDLPIPAWDVGIGTSIDDPSAVYFGEMELWRSTNGGNNFTKVAEWWEYYNDVPNKIHADIMNLQTYKRQNGTEFTLIPNHGGVSISYNNLLTTNNIGLIDLNVGQFYDVASSPINPSFIFGGTQDQGLLRTASGSLQGTVGFEQVISGDYGAQQFSNNGQSFWTQYPGGDFSYYANAMMDAGPTYWFAINGTNLPNAGWIIPSSAAPNPSDDYILVGGGDITGGGGSHLIKLENQGSVAVPTQFPFNFDADAGRPISAIETTSLDENKWYVSTENGHFYHSEDAGANWTEASLIVGPGSNWIYSADIYASKLTTDLVFLGGTNYASSPVYMSTNGGDTFIPLNGGNLPPTMVHEMCMDSQENFLFAATDAGPYIYDMNQEEWFDLSGIDAPIQEYISVEYISSDDIVRFATWGRGIWDFKIADVSGTVVENPVSQNASVFPNPSNGAITVYRDLYSQAKIFNVNGQEVLHIGLIAGSNNLMLDFLDAGTYLMVGMDENGLIWKEKLLIEK